MDIHAQHHHFPDPEHDYSFLKKETLRLTGINLDFYKEAQMKRRIDTLMLRKNTPNYVAFVQLLNDNPAELDFYAHYVTINVTEFFRDVEPWEQLENTILPQLLNRFGTKLKIWSVACSSGEEPYTLAMCLSRMVSLDDIRIIATDIDPKVLQAAQEGRYLEQSVTHVPEDLMERFFTREGDHYCVKNELKRCVEFRKLDLHQDEYPQDCHLIVCRNVLIYFTTEAKEMIFDNFRACGAPGSCLFLGKAEQIVSWKRLGYLRERPCFYFQ